MADRVAGLVTINEDGAPPLQETRQYGLDYSSQIIAQQWNKGRFITTLTSRAKKEMVPDPQFRTLEDEVPTHNGTLQGDDGSGSAAAITTTSVYFNITNASLFLQAGDMLHIPDDQANNDALGTSRPNGENLVVSEVDVGGDTDVIRCARNNGDPALAATYNITATSGNTLNWYLIPNALKEGGNASEPKSDSPSREYNYVQDIDETWQVSDIAQATKFIGGAQMPRAGMRAHQNFVLKMERMFITGQRALTYDGTAPVRKTGGVMWHMTYTSDTAGEQPIGAIAYSADTDLVTGNVDPYLRSRIWKVGDLNNSDNWSIPVFNTFMLRANEWASGTKVLVCGGGFLAEWQTLFNNMYRMTPGEVAFTNNVMSYEAPSGRVEVLLSEAMTQSGYSNDALCLDFDYINYAYMDGLDVHINEGIQDNDTHAQRNELRAVCGLKMGFLKAHSWIKIGRVSS